MPILSISKSLENFVRTVQSLTLTSHAWGRFWRLFLHSRVPRQKRKHGRLVIRLCCVGNAWLYKTLCLCFYCGLHCWKRCFLLVSYGCQFSGLLLDALQFVDDISTLEDQSTYFNKPVSVWTSDPIVSTYLERASGRVHDGILNKFINAFLARIPAHNPISSASTATKVIKKVMLRALMTMASILSLITTSQHGKWLVVRRYMKLMQLVSTKLALNLTVLFLLRTKSIILRRSRYLFTSWHS